MKKLDASLFRGIKQFGALSDTEIKTIIDAPDNGTKNFAPNTVIYRENDPGDHMYIVLDGFIELYVKGEMGTRDTCIATINAGECFGENVAVAQNAVKYESTAKVSIMAAATVFKIHKKYVFSIGRGEIFPPDKVRDMLIKLPLFKGLNRDELRNVREWAPMVDYKAGSYIYEPGTQADSMYVVLQGRVELSSLDDSGNHLLAASEGPGEYFGEEAMLPGGDDKHNIFAKATADARLIQIPIDIFKSLLNRDSTLIDNIKMVQNLRKLKMKNPRSGDRKS